MSIRASILLFLPWLLAGCSSTNLSKVDPFCDYVGRTVALRQPVDIVKGDEWPSPKYYMIPKGSDVMGHGMPIFSELPTGHQVHIDSVWNEIGFEYEVIKAYGHTTIPPSTSEIAFSYSWGSGDDLDRAPWEPDTTPVMRRVAQLSWMSPYESTNIPTCGTKIKQ